MQKNGIGDIFAIANLIQTIIEKLRSSSDNLEISLDTNDILKLFAPYNIKNKDVTNLESTYKLSLKGFKYIKKTSEEIKKILQLDGKTHKELGPFLFEVFKLTIMCIKKIKDRYINNIDYGVYSPKEIEQLDSNIVSSINS